MAVQSKLIDGAIKCSCQEYIHPWTASCVNGAAGILLSSAPSSMRTYCIVYLVSHSKSNLFSTIEILILIVIVIVIGLLYFQCPFPT